MSGSCRVAFRDMREPPRLSGSGRETLPDVREWSGDPPRCSGVLRRALSDVQEWSGVSLGCPGGPLGCLGVVGRLSRLSGRVSRPLPDILEGLLTLSGHSEVCPDHSRTSVRGSRPLLDIWEKLPTTPGHPREPPTTSRHLIGSPGHPGGPSEHSRTFERTYRTSVWASQTCGRAFQTLPDICKASWTSGWACHPSRTFGRVSRPLPDIR